MVVVVQRGFAASFSLSFLHLNFFLFLLSVPLLPISKRQKLYLSHSVPEQCFSKSINFYFHFLWSPFPAGGAVNDWGRDTCFQYFNAWYWTFALWWWFLSVLHLRSPLCYTLSLSQILLCPLSTHTSLQSCTGVPALSPSGFGVYFSTYLCWWKICGISHLLMMPKAWVVCGFLWSFCCLCDFEETVWTGSYSGGCHSPLSKEGLKSRLSFNMVYTVLHNLAPAQPHVEPPVCLFFLLQLCLNSLLLGCLL